ncbi:MAG TPA: hypothetical protein VFJ16_15930 [Longimicrobium sp.]|nr:hypothetical protein [Longimicrobium sp.]
MPDRFPSAPPPAASPRWFSLMPPIAAAPGEPAARPGCVRRVWLALTRGDGQRGVDEAA